MNSIDAQPRSYFYGSRQVTQIALLFQTPGRRRLIRKRMALLLLCGLIATEGKGQPVVEIKPNELGIRKAQAIDNAQAINKAQAINADAQNLAAQKKKLEQWIRVEVAFVRRVVALSQTQEASLAAIDISKIDALRVNNRKTAPGVVFSETNVPGIGSRLSLSDPLYQHRFRRDVEKAIEAILDEKQVGMYQAERSKRDAFAREVAVDGLVLVLDQKLGLSPEQCSAIKQSLVDWNDTTSINFNFYLSNSNYLPPVPENFVVPHLNASQRKVFETTPRIHVAESGVLPFVSGEIQIER